MMYKLNLMPYNYQVKENKEGKIVDAVKKYDVCTAIINVMLSPRQGLKGFRQYTVGKTAMRIEKCQTEFILLDATEYATIKAAFDQGKGYGPNDAELLRRIYEIETLEG